MKWLGIFILWVNYTATMEQALRSAIQEGNLERVSSLIAQTKNNASEDNSLLSKPLDLKQLHQFATTLTPERKAQTEHRAHPAVYKRVAIGGATVLVSLVTVGNYIYQALSTKQGDFTNLCATLIAGGTAIAHGYRELKLGIQNQDAKNAHANHLAITHMLMVAQQEKDSEGWV